ncbi:MAG: MFS transporter [Anaerolineae bacterium]|nr:MFS transporter [Anaerolineae bacterium]
MASLTVEKDGLRSRKRKRRKATSKERRAWYLYDFGNSAYAAVVLLAVYSAYFKGQVVGGAEGSRLWGIAVGIAMLVVALISPVLGAIADHSATKKRFLFFFTALACVFTALLFFVQEGNIVMGMLFFILAEIGYRSAQVFYNSLLPEIAEPDEIARVSGIGWAIGSAGGILCLLLILPLIMLIPGDFIVRLSLVITAVFFAVSTIPIFRDLKEWAEPKPLPQGGSYITEGFKQAFSTLRKARNYREFIKFVISFLIYNDGIMMTMNFASIIGAVLFGMGQQELIIFVIVVQITNVIGAYVFGLLADRWNTTRALVVSILTMVGAIVWMYFTYTQWMFFLVGAVAGFAMAGMQSLSRTMVGTLSPEGQSAEFYGFFAVAGRTSSFIGPTVYGWVAYRAALWFESQGLAQLLAEQNGQRVAILAIGVFLLIGMGLLFTVNVKKAQAAIAEAEA